MTDINLIEHVENKDFLSFKENAAELVEKILLQKLFERKEEIVQKQKITEEDQEDQEKSEDSENTEEDQEKE